MQSPYYQGVHCFVGCSGFSFSGVQMLSGPRLEQAGIGFVLDDAVERLLQAQVLAQAFVPARLELLDDGLGSSSAASACSRTSSFTSSSETSIRLVGDRLEDSSRADRASPRRAACRGAGRRSGP